MLAWQNINWGGTTPPTPKLACFVFYLKINNTFLKNNVCILQ